jgi:hypothetical protein
MCLEVTLLTITYNLYKQSILFLLGGAINRSSQVIDLLHTLVIGP